MIKIVADTSVIINDQLVSQIESGSIRDSEIIIPQAVFDEIQSQASNKKEKGFIGIEKIQKLQKLSKDFGLTVSVQGTHPSLDDIKLAASGRIDALIIDLAKKISAILYTSDNLQHLMAQTNGVDSVHLKSIVKTEPLEFLKFFDEQTMSVHLKENQTPLAKRGKPGSFLLTDLDGEILDRKYLELIFSQILDASNASDAGSVDISKAGASVIQYGDYRIAITYPPFSELFEITIVHPIAKLSLDDYSVSEFLDEAFFR